MDNRTLSKRLAKRAQILEKEHANLFRIRAYRRAAETILGLEQSVEMLMEKGGRELLASLPNIGPRLSRTIEDLIRGQEAME